MHKDTYIFIYLFILPIYLVCVNTALVHQLSAFLCLNDKLVTVKCLKRQYIYISLKMAMNLTKNVLGFFCKKKKKSIQEQFNKITRKSGSLEATLKEIRVAHAFIIYFLHQ